MSYEHATRKQCYKQMTLKGIGFADALVWSWKDAATKERQFTTPLSLCHKRPQPWLQDKPWLQDQPDKGGGRTVPLSTFVAEGSVRDGLANGGSRAGCCAISPLAAGSVAAGGAHVASASCASHSHILAGHASGSLGTNSRDCVGIADGVGSGPV